MHHYKPKFIYLYSILIFGGAFVFLQAVSSFVQIISGMFFLVGYVSNTNSFPQPLEPDEERKIIEMYKNGDEEARNILIERNLRLVAHIVKKYGSCGNDCDDLISIGTIGLIKAISTFDNTKGTRLATYAARCIENEILMSKDMRYKLELEYA